MCDAGWIELKDATFSFTHSSSSKPKLKNDIIRNLPLNAIKYLPAFVDNLELRVKFSTSDLVCLQIPIDDYVKTRCKIALLSDELSVITIFFVSVGQTITAYTNI